MLPGLRRQFAQTGVTSVPDAPVRLLIGPVNSAGQAYEWAQAASERRDDVSAASMVFRGDDDVYGFRSHHVVPATALLANARWRHAQHRAVTDGFTHVLIESGRHLWEPDGDVVELVRVLQRRGIRVGMLWHGSDIRSPSEHRKREVDSPFVETEDTTQILERISERHHRIAEEVGVPLFVSTPDLLTDLPTATWLPLAVEPARWASASDVLARARPVVVHAPTRSALKGTTQIADAVQRLHDEGVIEYRELHGVPASTMPQVIANADVVLDQFLIGSYGVAACEALAAGRVVVGHVSPQVRAAVRDRTGKELPIVESSASGIESALRRIAAEREAFVDVAEQGPAFVQTVHDGRAATVALGAFLGS